MDKINFILERLHIDSSIIYQFLVFVVLFYFLKYTIFNKLKEVVVSRESSTTSLDTKANKRIQEAVNLENDYREESIKIYKQAQDHFSEQRSVLTSETQKEIKNITDEHDKLFSGERENIFNAKESALSEVLSNVEALSKNLISKLTK